MFDDNKELGALVTRYCEQETTRALRLWQFQATLRMLKALVKAHPAIVKSVEKKCPTFSENIQIFAQTVNDLTTDFQNPYYDREIFDDQLNLCTTIVETIASDFGAPVEIIR